MSRRRELPFAYGLGRAELPKGLDKLGASATVRNWRTVTKLHDRLAA